MATLTFIKAPNYHLGKRYEFRGDRIVKIGEPRVSRFNYLFHEVDSFDSFTAVLMEAGKHPSVCLIRAAPSQWFPRDGKPVLRRLVTKEGWTTEDGSGTMIPDSVMRAHNKKLEEAGNPPVAPNVYWLATLEDQPTPWVMIDCDGIDSPDGATWILDPEGTAEWVRDDHLPPCFQGASLFWQITGGAHDPSKPDGNRAEIRMRLGAWLDRGLTEDELKGLFAGCPVDDCTFTAIQPIYTAPPKFARGITDPVPRRSGILEGEFSTVEVPRDLQPLRRARKPGKGGGSVRRVVQGAPAGTGLVDPLPEPFLEALDRVGDGAGECRTRLGNAAYVYGLWVGVERTDIDALAERLAEEGRKHRTPGEVEGYGLESLIHFRLGFIEEAPRDPGDPDDPFEQPAEAANDDSPEPAEPVVDISVEEAATNLGQAVRGWVEEGLRYHPDPGTSPPHRAIKAAAGIGKTTVTLQTLAELAGGKTVHFYVPNHDLAEELRQKAEAMGIRSAVIYGRGRPDVEGPRNADGSFDNMCMKSEIADLVARAGLPVWETMCKSKEVPDGRGSYAQCEHFEYCSYVNQFNGLDGYLIIMPHNWLTLPRKKLPDPSLVVIDERFFPIGIRQRHWPWSRITRPLPFGTAPFEGFDPAEHVATAEAVGKALWAGEHPRQHGLTVEQLERAAKAEYAAGAYHMPHPAMGPLHQRRIVKEYQERDEHRALAKIYRLLAEDFEMPRPTPRVLVVKGRKTPDGLTDDVFCHWTDYRLPGAPTLLIDADVDPVITEAIMPGVEMVEIEPPMQARVVQVHDTACSRRKLTEDNGSRRTLARIAALATREANKRKKVLVVGYKPAIEMVGEIEGVATLWFGNLRGLDAYKNYDVVIIAGREQTRAVVVEAVARALFYRDADPLVLPGEYVDGRRRYRTRDGHIRFGPLQMHPDPRVQRIVEQSRERETEQAVARLRLVHRPEPAEVFLLSNLPTRLIVDEFVAWNGLLPDKVEQAAQESDGVVLLTPSEMARCYPERWPTRQAAKDYLRRRKLGAKSPIDPLGKMHPVSYRSTYSGFRGPAPRALIPPHMSKAEAEAALAAIVGPLIVIDYAPGQEDGPDEATA